ncbi:cyclin-dependent kinase 4 isoform X1 [Osmia bicornis bicornis]|uniref:cyclin-dependent kinase 4 isoform X1 n=1 Tax=Osmia bicornis bicornis TaxID=1437191 RepID=UPI0010F96B02|nr:cyclin-dependent kinase 4 isoform X1 [Osmia bicornis bicornis]XP_029052831.1 cyclin-dependent kinase 4 isoform X1 [Osmia bicornis bicornis]XP_029052833.1 cyclin-dependent kinase 4 isoform X1 [Osmia bicornis bicornis]XP_029052834.1 cyclin-dependent kinase 4 isoform X1 [Osmia bicornis bicornis]XP_046144617.1 cyclin-dependent kinase 4 isoform X1 [Osmia bicornis bicornis]
MAGTSRRPSSELGPDLSSPTPPKKSKFSAESSVEGPSEKEHELSTEELERSVVASLSGKTLELIPGGASGSSPFEISDESLDSTKQLIQTSLEGSVKVTAGCSKEAHFGSFETIMQMKYSGPEEQLSSLSKRSDTDSDVQIQTSLLGEDALYQELSLIGNGAYGTVYKAKDLNTGQVVALKKVRVPLTEDGLPTSTLREIATLKQLERFEHPHIVRLLDVCQGNYLHLPSADGRSERLDRGLTLWLVFEHVERDLASYMASCTRSGILPHLVKQMSKEILRGVEFLHSHRIIHRDLKPQNLLVSREGRIKIADFGLAKTYDFEMRLTSVVVTQWYRAPEVLLGCSYATPVDIWSVGCILAELSRLKPLFPGTSEGDQLDRIFQVIGTPSQEEWPENVSLSWTAFPNRQPKPLAAIISDLNEHGLDLIKNLLMFNPHSRLTATQALRHQYFAEDDS